MEQYGASNELKILVGQLIKEANELLSALIEKTKLSDNRSKLQKGRWTERHRLHVLLEAAQRTEKSLPQTAVNPHFLAELKATVEVIRRWYDKPIWKDIEPSLVNSTHFTHTIAKLYIAEHLQGAGHKVMIVPRGEEASPDLMVQAIGTQDWVSIECYQPKTLDGRAKISAKELEKIVKQSMKKAKRQLGETTPGILAICGFNQHMATLEELKQKIVSRLQKTERPNLCGIITFFFGIRYSEDKDNRMFTPIITVDFVPNPSYFGRVNIDSGVPQDDSKLVREPLVSVSAEALFSKKTDQLFKVNSATLKPATEAVVKNAREERLKLIEKPANVSRATIYSKDTLPLFRGEGNINYICGQCGAILAEHAWELSISNIVVKCPCCQSYNEFPEFEEAEFPSIGTIAIEKGDYDFTGVVMLKRGVRLVGL